jgi:hypothetical protein
VEIAGRALEAPSAPTRRARDPPALRPEDGADRWVEAVAVGSWRGGRRHTGAFG